MIFWDGSQVDGLVWGFCYELFVTENKNRRKGEKCPLTNKNRRKVEKCPLTSGIIAIDPSLHQSWNMDQWGTRLEPQAHSLVIGQQKIVEKIILFILFNNLS